MVVVLGHHVLGWFLTQHQIIGTLGDVTISRR